MTTLNGLSEGGTDCLEDEKRYERGGERGGGTYRTGRHECKLATASDKLSIRIPKLEGIRFTTAIVEHYRRRETSSRRR